MLVSNVILGQNDTDCQCPFGKVLEVTSLMVVVVGPERARLAFALHKLGSSDPAKTRTSTMDGKQQQGQSLVEWQACMALHHDGHVVDATWMLVAKQEQ